jgi:HSP20 family protein
MRRFAADLDRFFGDVGTSLAAGFTVPSLDAAWKPVVEVSERGGNLVIRAELPGLAVKDVKVELRDDALMIQGERRQEREQKGKGYFRSERSYGSFLRQIPVPEGTTPASVKATFKDGVLEVTMPAPARPAKGHNVAIEQG